MRRVRDPCRAAGGRACSCSRRSSRRATRSSSVSERPEGFGYLLKDRVVEIDEFLDAVRRVGNGGTVVDPEVVAQLLGRRASDEPLDELTRASARCSG